MALLHIPALRISGISATVPQKRVSNSDCELIPEKEREQFIQATGIRNRRIANPEICASDLCLHAAEKLLIRAQVPSAEIEALIFVTQTPDYLIPGNAAWVKEKLQVPDSCFCLDLHQGCAGYVFGLSVAAAYIRSGCKNVLLLAGDTLSRQVHPQDKSTVPLFSDAGSATLISADPESAGMWFDLGSTGKGYDAILQSRGGSRNPFHKGEDLSHPEAFMKMEGHPVFNFSVKAAHESVNRLLNSAGITGEEIDYFTFHQANLLINESIRRRLGIAPDRYPLSLEEFGNTSSASIPLTLCAQLSQPLQTRKIKHLLCGFGAGLSWASSIIQTENLTCALLSEVS